MTSNISEKNAIDAAHWIVYYSNHPTQLCSADDSAIVSKFDVERMAETKDDQFTRKIAGGVVQLIDYVLDGLPTSSLIALDSPCIC